MDDKDLINKLNKAANIVHNKTMRGSANYVVTNAQFAEVLNSLNEKEQKRKEREKKLKRILGSQK